MGSYKIVTIKTTVGNAISNGISALTELGEECREIVDNATDGLSETQRIQTLDETAGTLEEVQEPDVPDLAYSLECSYGEQVNKNKRRGCSRAIRCQNALAMISAAKEVLEAKQTELEERINNRENEPEGDDELTDDKDSIEALVEALEEIEQACESLEFPGMFG